MDIVDRLEELIAEGESLVPQGGNSFEGYNGDMQPDYVSWRLQAISAIQKLGAGARHVLQELEDNDKGAYFYRSSALRVLGALKGALAIARTEQEGATVPDSDETSEAELADSRSVFVVHGHQEALLHQAARFLEKLELQPVILFEQPGQGQTIIEKLETHSDVRFAIVLLTPDDLGRGAKEEEEPRPRARQNVILELGFFLGKLGRPNVVALYHESVELPSDYRGVQYIKIDAEGGWRLELARELKAAGIEIDMNRAVEVV